MMFIGPSARTSPGKEMYSVFSIARSHAHTPRHTAKSRSSCWSSLKGSKAA